MVKEFATTIWTNRSQGQHICSRLMPLVQAATLCLLLSGCVGAGINKTNLKDATVATDTELLRPVVYVIHDSLDRREWFDALSSFTSKENIFYDSVPQPVAGKIPEYLSRGPLVVQIRFEAVHREETSEDKFATASTILSLLTLSVIPGWMVDPYEFRASFQLSTSVYEGDAGPQWVYPYKRKMLLWLPLLPVADEFIFFGDFNLKDWKTEEKRRLILLFLKDATPTLQQIEARSLHRAQ